MGSLIAGQNIVVNLKIDSKLSSKSREIRRRSHFIHWWAPHIVGAGAQEGSTDAGNLLKPALARGTLRTIGATTLKEYRKYIEKDAALEKKIPASNGRRTVGRGYYFHPSRY